MSNPNTSNPNRYKNRFIFLGVCVATLAIASCTRTGNDDPVDPIAQALDVRYAAEGCLADTPYDPLRTDGGPEGVVKRSDPFLHYIYLTRSDGAEAPILTFTYTDAGLLEPDEATDISLHNFGC